MLDIIGAPFCILIYIKYAEKRYRYSVRAVIQIKQPGKFNTQFMSVSVSTISLVAEYYMIDSFKAKFGSILNHIAYIYIYVGLQIISTTTLHTLNKRIPAYVSITLKHSYPFSLLATC